MRVAELATRQHGVVASLELGRLVPLCERSSGRRGLGALPPPATNVPLIGYEAHHHRAAFERDHARDALLLAAGYGAAQIRRPLASSAGASASC